MRLAHLGLWVGVATLAWLCGGVAAQEWAVQARFKTSVNLTCTDQQVNATQINSAARLRWILPTGTLLDQGMTHARLVLHGKGEVLQITEVEEEDFGVYYCLLYHANHLDNQVVRKGLNLNGPYFGSLFELYRLNIIIGCIAAGVTAVVMLGCCFLYNRNNKQETYMDDEALELALHRSKHKEDEGYANGAMDVSSDVPKKEIPDKPENGGPPDQGETLTAHF